MRKPFTRQELGDSFPLENAAALLFETNRSIMEAFETSAPGFSADQMGYITQAFLALIKTYGKYLLRETPNAVDAIDLHGLSPDYRQYLARKRAATPVPPVDEAELKKAERNLKEAAGGHIANQLAEQLYTAIDQQFQTLAGLSVSRTGP